MIDIQVSKEKYISLLLIKEKTSSVLDEMVLKTVHKHKEGDQLRKKKWGNEQRKTYWKHKQESEVFSSAKWSPTFT